MTKNWAVYRNGLLMTKTLTRAKAQRLVDQYREAGFTAEVRSEYEDSCNSYHKGMADLLKNCGGLR